MQITEIGAAIQRLREEQHMSRARLGEMVGTTGMSIWRIETGKSEADYAKLAKIFEALGRRVEVVILEGG